MYLLQWFGEQPETVKLAIIAFVTGVFGGVLSILKEWRKPVLIGSPAKGSTSANAPATADDPALLLLAEITAMNFKLSELIATVKQQEPSQNDRIGKVLTEINELTSEIYLLRNVMQAKGN